MNFRSAVKPLSRAHWASTLNWHCTMESTSACNSGNLDVGIGTAGSTTGTVTVQADALPDLAIGRLPATTLAQAEALVAKLMAWEDSGQGLSGPAALVADNPDVAGDFEADVQDVAHLNYVGHGGAAVWASENVWNSWDAPSLQAQSQQPLLVTMNCLNGYFVAPAYESLSESLLKAEGRGAIASFSPSGLSLDGPAHQYHRALMAELTSGRHARLGDALLAAQKTYAETGAMPELVSIYHLFGDPALTIR